MVRPSSVSTKPMRAQAAQQGLILDDAQIALLAGDGAVFFAHFADGHHRVVGQAELFDALFIQLAQHHDHQRLIQTVVRAAVAEIGDGLEDAVVIVVHQAETRQLQQRLR